MKPISRKQYINSLIKDGWVLDRKNGKHDVYTHVNAKSHLAVPHGIEISVGIVRQHTPIVLSVHKHNKV